MGQCPACGGLWADNETLQAICTDQQQQQSVMGFAPAPLPAELAPAALPAKAYIPCPACRKLVNRRQFAGCSGVIVDWCKAHGTWFDRDELRRIVQFILAGGLNKSRERERMLLEEERRNLRAEKYNLERLSRLAANSAASPAQASFDADLFGILKGFWRSLGSGER